MTLAAQRDSKSNIRKEGLLEKKSEHVGVWRKRWSVLQYDPKENNHYLFTYHPEKKYTEPTASIRVDIVTVIGSYDKKNDKENVVFYVENQKDQKNSKLEFRANSTQERDSWMQSIKSTQTSIETKQDVEAKQYDEDTNTNLNDDGFPVFPLVMPNNCTYDRKTKTMTRNDKKRYKLIPYEPVKSKYVTSTR